ncbi:MAG: Thiol-disulfide oxidoreductase ResA [Hyphomicrobiaceae bacterium hypho_1]
MLLNTPPCELGRQAPDFLLEDTDSKSFKMSDHLSGKGLLLAFICNHCPYVQAICDRFTRDAHALIDDGFEVLAIMPNDYDKVSEDSPSNMKLFATKFGFRFPYLVDRGQKVAAAYGAVCTPDFFGLCASGKLYYRGRLDNIGMNDISSNRVPELFNAMHHIYKTGYGPRVQHPSMGCSIKWS